MKFTRFAALLVLFAVVTATSAQEIHNWRSSVTGWVWKDGSGQCWRDGSWTPATAAPGCDGAIAAVAAPTPAPVVVEPPVAVANPEPVAVAAALEPEPVAVVPAVQLAPMAEVAVVPVLDVPAPAPQAAPTPAVEVAPEPAPIAAPAPAPAPVVAAPAPVAKPAPSAIAMSFAADALFDFDKSVLKSEGKAKLKDLVAKIKDINLEVVIAVGHTDSVGTDAYNQKLSERRAEAVKAFLVSLGIPKNRIYTEGKGESEPVADNKTAAGRAKNRRVEVEVVGTK